jgi:hypothetical protein
MTSRKNEGPVAPVKINKNAAPWFTGGRRLGIVPACFRPFSPNPGDHFFSLVQVAQLSFLALASQELHSVLQDLQLAQEARQSEAAARARVNKRVIRMRWEWVFTRYASASAPAQCGYL